MISASRLLAPQQAALKAVKAVNVVQNIIRRPNTSEHGAQMRGPTTNPSTNPDVTIDQQLKVEGGETLAHDVHFGTVSWEVLSDVVNRCTHHTTGHCNPKNC